MRLNQANLALTCIDTLSNRNNSLPPQQRDAVAADQLYAYQLEATWKLEQWDELDQLLLKVAWKIVGYILMIG
jgi:hypothetical protein